MPTPPLDLTIRAESIQRLYDLYVSDRFEVNRRYQRKLVWTVHEKQKLIDSIQRDLPLPLVLVAELSTSDGALELIDGLQRMNAIFSFLENEYPVDGQYFDLDTLADTKIRKDRGDLTQKSPILDRENSAAVANYTIALSVFRAPSAESIEEIFRRINSGGRRLSRQSLRQAGTISPLADLVRVLSSQIRGDTSPGNSVPLRQMPNLSVTNYDLDYGVNVDEIFWVKNLILRREDIRESLDEQLILDLLIDCIIEPLPTSGTRVRDAYYNYVDSENETETTESIAATQRIEAFGFDQIESSFMRVYDEVRQTLIAADRRFANLVGVSSGGRSPRYFHAVYLAMHELMVRDRLRVRDYNALAKSLDGTASNVLSVPGGGGDWTGSAKRSVVDGLKGVMRPSFEGPIEGDDLSRFGYSSLLETVLSNSLVEQQLFECKQGLYRLDRDREFDQDCIGKIARTLTAMHNLGPGSVGFVAIGVADKEADVRRIEALDDIKPITYRNFDMVGIEREAKLQHSSLNDYWHWMLQKIEAAGLSKEIAAMVAESSRLVPYHGVAIGLLRVQAGNAPAFFNDTLVQRRGSDTVTVPHSEYMEIFSRFAS